MEPILIEETPAKVTVKYDSVAVDLPESIREQHEKFWNDHIKINPHYERQLYCFWTDE